MYEIQKQLLEKYRGRKNCSVCQGNQQEIELETSHSTDEAPWVPILKKGLLFSRDDDESE